MIRTLERLWDGSYRAPLLMASAAMIALIALVDWWTLPYVSLGFLYLFPIMLAAGFLPRWALIAVSVLCAAMTERFSSLDPQGRAGRLTFEVLALAGCGLFVSELRRFRLRSLESEGRLRVLIETSPAAIVLADEQGRIEMANQAAMAMLLPHGAMLTGQPIGDYLPDLSNVLQPGTEVQFRTSMQCAARRGNGDCFCAEIWFSTFPQDHARKLAAIVADVTEDRMAPAEPAPAPQADGRQSLTDRQMAVLRLVLQGLPGNQIAARLGITTSLAKTTLRQLFSKAGARNRSQMVRFALEHYRDWL